MNITLRETIHISDSGVEKVVRQNTQGVLRGKTVFFYDATRTSAVGFDLDFCFENKQMFSVRREITDREVSVKEVLKIINELTPSELHNPNSLRILAEKIKSL